jgi:protein-S-isoprenylcysteine O-methyltransferase Ste14
LGRIFFGIILFSVVIFLPAGRFDWLEGWAFLVFFFTFSIALMVWGWRKDPELMKERGSIAGNVEGWDRLIMGVHTALMLAMILVAALDAGRFGWSSTPFVVRIMGWFGLSAAAVLIWRVMAANTYLSRMVRIQEDRAQRVISTGPYRYIRHPMYVGTILFVLCTPLVLGSWWALVPGTVDAILFIIRTALEDRTLKEKLTGYEDYAGKVRYRLLPRIW